MSIAGMMALNQWVNYKLVPRAGGKTDKIPVCPTTGVNVNAQDRAAWQTYEQAVATGLPIGFVFTEDDPFGFFDLDGCLDAATGEWNDTAKYVFSIFQGCAMEVSQSGTGGHIFYTIPPGGKPHGTRCAALKAEMYSHGRFVAFTGMALVGDCRTVPPVDQYNSFIDFYFPAKLSGAGAPAEDWTNEPVPEWSGPEDNDELISRMRKSKNVLQIMGAGIGAADLIDMDEGSLAEAYPDTGGLDRAFDWSKADSALCSHLAWWTGKNCDRMLEIWGSLPLGDRDKFRNRSDYVTATILGAVGMCKSVYHGRKSDRPPPAPAENVGRATPGEMREGYQYMDPTLQVTHFKGCVYVINKHAVYVPGREGLLKPEQFKTVFGGYVFGLDSINDKNTRNAWEAFSESQVIDTPICDDVCFRPDLKPGAIMERDGLKFVNTFVPIETPCIQGDPGPFLDFMTRILPDGRDRQILTSYMAAVVQYQGHKFYWCPVVQGAQGNGKGFLDEILREAIGMRYTHQMESQDISNVFNAWVGKCVYCFLDEVKVKRNDLSALEVLKKLVTNRVLPLQGKGKDQSITENCVKLLLCSNHKDAVPKDENDRRFAVFYCAQQSRADLNRSGMVGDYFPSLWNWARNGGFAIINNYLREYQIPDELNPATHCHRAPDTSSTSEAVTYNKGVVEQQVLEAIEEGRTGFTGGWISSMALNRLFNDLHIKMAFNKRPEMLLNIGYLPHPHLPGGRVNKDILIEGGKPRLYIKDGHVAANETRGAEIVRMYCEAQNYAIGEMAGPAGAVRGV